MNKKSNKTDAPTESEVQESEVQSFPPIDSVRVYQAVTFNKRSETFFSTRDINGNLGKQIEMLDKFISVKSATDHILVPYTNVSAIYLLSKIKEEQIQFAKDSKAKNVGITSSEINRPSRIGRD